MSSFLQSKINNKYAIATAIALLFHIVGLIGILYIDQLFFSKLTPYNLLLMFSLLIWTTSNKNIFFYIFLFTCMIVGIAVEIIGVNTGMLFGNYRYGAVLGPQIKSVPWLISINWFIIIYCCGIFVHTFLAKIINRIAVEKKEPPVPLKSLSVIVDGATLAVFFDWIMEPVAIRLGYWQWNDGTGIPFFNYVSWFIISIILMSVFKCLKFSKHNKFAIHLLLIQLMFFLLLRTFI